MALLYWSDSRGSLLSTDPRDQAEVDSWFKTAAGRRDTSMNMRMPYMKQPDWNNAGYSRQAAENKMETQYAEKENSTQTVINAIDSQRESQKQDTYIKSDALTDKVDHNLKHTKGNIEKKHEAIKNDINTITQEGKTRGEDGAAWSAIKHAFKSDDKK